MFVALSKFQVKGYILYTQDLSNLVTLITQHVKHISYSQIHCHPNMTSQVQVGVFKGLLKYLISTYVFSQYGGSTVHVAPFCLYVHSLTL